MGNPLCRSVSRQFRRVPEQVSEYIVANTFAARSASFTPLLRGAPNATLSRAALSTPTSQRRAGRRD